jgi:hypothetical protein
VSEWLQRPWLALPAEVRHVVRELERPARVELHGVSPDLAMGGKVICMPSILFVLCE